MTTLERIKKYIQSEGISVSRFERSVGYSNGAFNSQLKHGRTIGVDKLEKILEVYPGLNPTWLLTGRGPMVIERSDLVNEEAELYLDAKKVNERLDTIIEQNRKILKQLGKDE